MSAFLDALAAGRRPRGFRANPDDAAVLRTAIELAAARPDEATPDPQFVSRLHQELVEPARAAQADQAGTAQVVPMVRPRPRGRIALVSVAAGLALVGATAAATENIDHSASTRAALPLPHGQQLRTGTFEDASSQNLGQIVVYEGNPSWVFMVVKGSSYDGPVTCRLHAPDGSTVMTGAFYLRHGTGQLAKTIRADVGQLGGAQLVTSTGATLASATFS
jgi:hypothetical protein